jgi:hypothetical protein
MQKKSDLPPGVAATSRAKKSGRKVSEIMHEAADATIADVNLDDLKMLDTGT